MESSLSSWLRWYCAFSCTDPLGLPAEDMMVGVARGECLLVVMVTSAVVNVNVVVVGLMGAGFLGGRWLGRVEEVR